MFLTALLAGVGDGATVRVTIVPAPASDKEKKETPEEQKPPPKEKLTVDIVLDRMEAARKKLKTFRATLTKLTTVAVIDLTEKSEGTMHFKMPRLFRMALKDVPDKKAKKPKKEPRQIIYIVGKVYGWIYRPKCGDKPGQAERARLRRMTDSSKSANPLEYGLAKDMHELRKAYRMKLLPEAKIGKADTVPLELTPIKARKLDVGKMIFWIDKKGWMPAQIRLYKSNNETIETYTFLKMEVNVKISDKLFEFEPPDDVEVMIHDAAEEPPKR